MGTYDGTESKDGDSGIGFDLACVPYDTESRGDAASEEADGIEWCIIVWDDGA